MFLFPHVNVLEKIKGSLQQGSGYLRTSNLGAVVFCGGIALLAATSHGSTLVKLWESIDWQQVITGGSILAMVTIGMCLMSYSYRKRPDEMRAAMLAEQEVRHEYELTAAVKKARDEGFMSGQAVSTNLAKEAEEKLKAAEKLMLKAEKKADDAEALLASIHEPEEEMVHNPAQPIPLRPSAAQ